MKNRMAILLLAVAALVAVPAFGANLTVTNAAAMSNTVAQNDCAVVLNPDGTDATPADNEPGPCGLEVNNDGTTQRAFVTDATPVDESIYRSLFFWDPNDLETAGTTFPVGAAMTLFRTRDDAFNGAFQVMTRLTRNRGFRLWIRALSNNGNAKFTARVDLGCDLGGPCVVPRVTLPVSIQSEWTQGDVCGAASGSATQEKADSEAERGQGTATTHAGLHLPGLPRSEGRQDCGLRCRRGSGSGSRR